MTLIIQALADIRRMGVSLDADTAVRVAMHGYAHTHNRALFPCSAKEWARMTRWAIRLGHKA